jgi:hypothetical protein
VSSRAEYLRQKTAECAELAAVARDPEVKRMFLEAARQWREMAEQAERLGW